MGKGLKIFACVMVFLGVLSLIFLLTSKNKAQIAAEQQALQAANKVAPATKKVSTTQTTDQTATQAKLQANKTLIRSQWQKCKDKTIAANTNLFWNVQIFEEFHREALMQKGIWIAIAHIQCG
jgi:hypothetical protein